jgi:hypothetical protein
MPRKTVFAATTGGTARCKYLMSHFVSMDALSYLHNFARKFMPDTKGLYTLTVVGDTHIIAVVHVQIRAANTAPLDLNDDTIIGR